MSARDSMTDAALAASEPQLGAPSIPRVHTALQCGVVIGELVALTEDRGTALVMFPGQSGSAAIYARSTVDLHAVHVSRSVVLMFEQGDPARPIVMGVLRGEDDGRPEERPGQIELDPDGERLLVNATRELVLRCGASSITLTSGGKVLIKGHYVVTCSSGMNRIKGGSVQIN